MNKKIQEWIKLTYDKYDNRYYSKERYEAALGTFMCGVVFALVAVLALVFLAIDVDFISLSSWGYWLFIPAFFIILAGFGKLYTNIRYKKVVKNAILQRGQGTYKLEHIALEVGIRPRDILRVLVDLRNKGKIQYSFKPETGEIVLGQAITYVQSTSFVPPAKKLSTPLPTKNKNFCVYCGHEIKGEVKFCPSCGSKL